MTFSLSPTGTLVTTEARERELTGYQANTIDLSAMIDTNASFDDSLSIGTMLDMFGIHFSSTDTLISIFPDGSVEAQEFIEGSRISLDNSSRLTVVFLQEEV